MPGLPAATPLVDFEEVGSGAEAGAVCPEIAMKAEAAALARAGFKPQQREQLVVLALLVDANVDWVTESHVHVRSPPLGARAPHTVLAVVPLDADDGFRQALPSMVVVRADGADVGIIGLG